MTEYLTNKLLLNWKSSIDFSNHIVGLLEKVNDGYTFKYVLENLDEAIEKGFSPLIGLSDVDKLYISENMFSVFERRLPGQKTFEFKKFLKDNKIKLFHNEDVIWDYFVITGAKLATDSLSFKIPIILIKNRLYFFNEVAGWPYYEEESLFKHDTNREMVIIRESNNVKDIDALMIVDKETNNKIGYIPRPFNKVFSTILKHNIDVNCKFISFNSKNRPVFNIYADSNAEENLYEKLKKYHYLIDHLSTF